MGTNRAQWRSQPLLDSKSSGLLGSAIVGWSSWQLSSSKPLGGESAQETCTTLPPPDLNVSEWALTGSHLHPEQGVLIPEVKHASRRELAEQQQKHDDPFGLTLLMKLHVRKHHCRLQLERVE